MSHGDAGAPRPVPTPTRRAALAAALAPLAPLPAAAHPDSALLAACAAYRQAKATFNVPVDLPEAEHDARWEAVEAAESIVSAARATTLDGLRAKAALAVDEAMQPYGGLMIGFSFAGEWAWQVARDLLALRSGGMA